jgi:hypothetical protein
LHAAGHLTQELLAQASLLCKQLQEQEVMQQQHQQEQQ